MRARIAGSLLVVAVTLVPTLVGGPVFAIFIAALLCVGFREYLGLAAQIESIEVGPFSTLGFAVVLALGVVPLIDQSRFGPFAVSALAIAAPFLLLYRTAATPGGFTRWSLVSSGSLYLGLPTYSAVSLRQLPGDTASTRFSDFATRFTVAWDAAPRGLAWALTVILAIWISDSVAYLAGRAFGSRKLAPALSPNKTVEGAIAGLAGAMFIAALVVPLFGVGTWWFGLLVGAVIGLAGLAGDLCESFLKRQAGVKDTGSLIPGHGGVLDRIDALLFAFPVAFILATGYEQLSRSWAP